MQTKYHACPAVEMETLTKWSKDEKCTKSLLFGGLFLWSVARLLVRIEKRILRKRKERNGLEYKRTMNNKLRIFVVQPTNILINATIHTGLNFLWMGWIVDLFPRPLGLIIPLILGTSSMYRMLIKEDDSDDDDDDDNYGNNGCLLQ